MITISAKTFDLEGSVVIKTETIRQQLPRRVSRTPTLDGGVVVNDGGFSHGDRRLTVTWPPANYEQVRRVQRLVCLYERLLVSLREGVLECAVESWVPGDTECQIVLLPVDKLTED